MKMQNQVYKIVDNRLKRICMAEYKKAMGKRKTRPKQITYPSIVDDMVGFLNELANEDCTVERAEEIYSIVMGGEIGNHFDKFCLS